ncbi:MAG: hypothetical protein GKC03_05620 [Methanomassiliicoccales archaeon]|nr:hypothetical protein [Methanomassiliicoccales archaeon]
MGDFALENGKVSKGIIGAILAAVKYLVIPVLIVSIILAMLSDFAEGYLPLEELEAIRLSLIVFALPVIALAFFVGFYPKGSYSRMTFGIIYVASICLWLWLAAQGGKIDASIEFVGLALDFTVLLLLFIFAASLKSLFYIAEAPSYREEFLKKKELERGAQPGPSGSTNQAGPSLQPQTRSEVQTEAQITEEPKSGPEDINSPQPATESTTSASTKISMPLPSSTDSSVSGSSEEVETNSDISDSVSD